MQKNNCEKGKIGEKIAVKYLMNNNFEIIQTNYRTSFGEIDIIAKDNEYIVFVEVKYRKNNNYGFPREAVGAAKQKNIITTAMSYIEENNLENVDFRFDVLEVLDGAVEHIKNAFW